MAEVVCKKCGEQIEEQLIVINDYLYCSLYCAMQYSTIKIENEDYIRVSIVDELIQACL